MREVKGKEGYRGTKCEEDEELRGGRGKNHSDELRQASLDRSLQGAEDFRGYVGRSCKIQGMINRGILICEK